MLALVLTMVFLSVAAVMGTRWRDASRWQLGVSGLLSMALGMRLMALATATILVPLGAQYLQAAESEDAAQATSTESTVVPAEGSASDSAKDTQTESAAIVVEKPDDAAVARDTAAAAGLTVAEAPEPSVTAQPVSSAKGAISREPVEMVTKIRYLSENRPSWVEAGPTDDNGVYTLTVTAGPYRTKRDCERDLQREVDLAVSDFMNTYLRAPHASKFIYFPLSDLRQRKVVREQFEEQLDTSVGLMNQLHAQLKFDEPFCQELDQRWSDIRSKSRLAQTGIGAAIVLLFLGTLFGFLKLDTATRGYYTGRLQLAASATILALVAASVLLMKWIPWM